MDDLGAERRPARRDDGLVAVEGPGRPGRGCSGSGTASSIGRSRRACWASQSITRAAAGCQKPRSARPTRAAIVPQSRIASSPRVAPGPTRGRAAGRTAARGACRRPGDGRAVGGGAVARVAAGDQPRQRDGDPRVLLGHPLGRERLHVEAGGLLGGVRDLEHRRAVAVDAGTPGRARCRAGVATPSTPNRSRASAAASSGENVGGAAVRTSSAMTRDMRLRIGARRPVGGARLRACPQAVAYAPSVGTT